MKRNQDKISLWKRKNLIPPEQEHDYYIARQINQCYPPDEVLRHNSFADYVRRMSAQ